MSSLKPCKFTPKGSTKELSYDEMRQHLMDNYELVEAKPKAKKNEKAIEQEGRNIPERERPTKYEPGQAVSKPEAKPTSEGGKGQEGGVSKPEEGKRKEEVKEVADATKATDDFLKDLGDQFAAEVALAAKPEAEKALSQKVIDKLEAVKAQIKGGTFSSLPFLPQAATLAIDTAIIAIKAGRSTIEAMKAAMDAFRSHTEYTGASDAQKIEAERDMSAMVYDVLGKVVGGETRKSKFGANALATLENEGAPKKLLKQLDPTYESRNQNDVIAAANELIELVGIDEAVNLAESNQIQGDVAAAVLLNSYGAAWENQQANPSESNARSLADAFRKLKQKGTGAGQTSAMFKKLREMFPEFVVDEVISDIRTAAKKAMGVNSSNPATGIHKAMNAAAKVGKVKNDVFNTIAQIMSGDFNLPTGTFNISDAALAGIAKKISNLSNKKVKEGLRTLLSFGQNLGADKSAKDVFGKLMDNVVDNGKLAVESDIEDVRKLVTDNLNDINGRLKQPMTPAQIKDTADAFVLVYQELAEAKMAQEINKAFGDKPRSISGKKNKKIAREILNGALDEESVRMKFAAKYGLPTLTPADVALLNQLASNAAKAKGGAKVTANNALAAAIQKIKNTQSTTAKIGEKFWWLPSFIYNNLLAYPKTVLTAFGSNVIRTGGLIIEAVFTGKGKSVSDVLGASRKYEIEIPDGKGGVIKKDLAINKTAIELMGALLGVPSLSQYREGGLSKAEQKINAQPSRWKRNVMRTFLTSGQRALGIADAMASPLVGGITQRQMAELLVKDMYKRAGLPVPSAATIADDVNSLINIDPSLMNDISSQAMNDVMSGNKRQQLIDRGSLDPNATFADIFGSKNPLKAETELFNEYKKRILEIHAEGQNDRLNDLQQRRGMDSTIDFTPEMAEVEKFIARKTNELAFLGRPPGSLGVVADKVNSVSESVPFLKYVGIMPMFCNAAFNGAAYIIKMTPGVNAVQLAKYKILGTRGFKKKGKGEFATGFIIKADQKTMARSVAATTAVAAAILLLLSKKSPEDEREDWTNGEGTGFIDNLTAGQKALLKDRFNNPLMEGWFYKDGYPMFEYSKTPLYGLFEAIAYTHNASVFERDYFGDKVFVEDSPEFMDVMGGYVVNSLYTVTDASAMKDFSSMFYTLMNYKADQKDSKLQDRAYRMLETKLASSIKNLIPLGRLQGGINNAVNAFGGDDKKFAGTFAKKLAMNTAFEDYIIHSNMTDPFGRNIEDRMVLSGMSIGLNAFEVREGKILTPLDELYAGDELGEMYLDRNYSVTARASMNAPIYMSAKDIAESESSAGLVEGVEVSGDIDAVGLELESMAAGFKKQGIKVKEIPKEFKSDVYAGFVYTLELEPEEVNEVNASMGGMVKNFIEDGDNKTILKGGNEELVISDETFRKVMNSAYDISKRISIYTLYGKRVGDSYRQALIKGLASFDKTIMKYGMTRPVEWQEAIEAQ